MGFDADRFMAWKPTKADRTRASAEWRGVAAGMEAARATADREAPTKSTEETLIEELRLHREALERATDEANSRSIRAQAREGFRTIRERTAANTVVTPVDDHHRIKKTALIKAHIHHWPSIEGDLNHGRENELSKAAKLPKHGWWHELRALEWAKREGKLTDPAGRPAVARSVFDLAK